MVFRYDNICRSDGKEKWERKFWTFVKCRQVATIPMVMEKKLASAEAEASLRNKGKLLQRLLNSNSNANGHADHGVVTCAQEAHHLNVGGDGGRAGELSVAVHTAHGIGQAIGSGACSHVVGVQSTAGAAAGSRKT